MQKHRGRDGDGVLFVDNVALGHTRLSVIDLSAKGSQPIKLGHFNLTYNGEIYNYKDFYTGNGNDAIALLEQINKVGLDLAVTHLNGMFAFGLYNQQTKDIHLVVDRIGQKPLYYTSNGEGFAFASTPVALLKTRDKWSINKTALESYWKLGSVMGNLCIWEGITKVEGGTIVTYNTESKQISVKRYWSPQFVENTSGIQDLVIDAIDKIKVADVPVHIFLSGGIDSSLVASRFQGGNAIHLESIETQYAQQVATKFNIDLKTVSPVDVDLRACLIDYALKCGEPSMAGIIPYITAGEVKKYAKVAVTANGADELFFGYDRTEQNITTKQINHIFRAGFNYEYQLPEIDPRLSQGRWLELMTYIQHDLNKTLDFASMAHTVEMRAPFLDHRLIEMALSIPQEHHGRKEILKNMLRALGFDEKFIQRQKQGFSLHYTPKDMNQFKDEAFNWCIAEGHLTVRTVSVRDIEYLKMCALSYYWFYLTFKHLIE